MPFVDISLAGSAPCEQKVAIVAARRLLPSPGRRHAGSLVERLGKSPAAVQVVISAVSKENHGGGGQFIADCAAAKHGEDAHVAVTSR